MNIKYTKNRTDGIKLYTRRVSEKEFTELGITLRGNYTDNRPKLSDLNPEAREYYAEYFVNMRMVGKRSNIIKVIIP